MASRVIPIGVGLHTDPSALTVPPGALRRADNVLLHRPGTIQPRPGFGDVTGASPSGAAYVAIGGRVYDGDVVVQDYDADGEPVHRLRRLSTTTAYQNEATATRDVTPLYPHLGARVGLAEMRGNLYVATAAGVFKLSAATDTDLIVAGSWTDYHTYEPWARLGSSDRYAVGTQKAVSYRYCWVRIDANGYEARSAPSPRIVLRNSSASTTAIAGVSRLYLPRGVRAGDLLELYRTANILHTSDPGDEHFGTTRYAVTAADVEATYIDVGAIWDALLDEERGAALYTNASQGGILTANEPPPTCKQIAAFGDVMWFGNVREREALIIEPIQIYDTAKNEYALQGIHFSSQSVTTAGSTTLTLTDPTGLKVGQYVTEGNPPENAGSGDFEVVEGDRTHFQAQTTITALSSSIVVETNANISDGDTIELTDLTSIAALPKWTWKTSGALANEMNIGADAGESADNLADAINATTTEVYGAGVITATSDSVDTVTIVSGDGHGLDVTLTQANPGAVSTSYQATLSAAAKTSTSATGYFWDAIEINGARFYIGTGAGTLVIAHYEDSAASGGDIAHRVVNIDTTALGSTTNLDQCKEFAKNLADAINAVAIRGGTLGVRAYLDDVQTISTSYANDLNDQEAGPAAIVLIAEDPTDSVSFEALVRPAGWRTQSSGQIDAGSGTRRNRVYYSKPSEPEAVPSVNYVDIGSREEDILALVPLENALLVFKSDGVWRITGAAPNGWVVDELDLSVRLLTGDMVQVADNVAWALTDRGLLAFTEGGAVKGPNGTPRDFAAPIRDEMRTAQAVAVDMRAASTIPLPFWMAHHRRLGLLLVAVGTSAASTAADDIWVYHLGADAWTRWDRADYAAIWDHNEDRMLVSPSTGSSGQLLYEREGETAATYYDRTVDTIDTSPISVSSNVLTWPKADFDGETPKAGDVIYLQTFAEGGTRVTAVEDNGSDWGITVEDAGGASGSIDAVWYQAIACALEWQAQHLPGRSARWGTAQLEWLEGTYLLPGLTELALTVGGRSQRDASAQTITASQSADLDRSGVTVVGLPRNVVRAKHLFPYLALTEAGTLWRLSGLTLEGRTESQRVAR